MMSFVLASVPFIMKIVVGIWVFVAVVLVFLVLIQKGRGGGLSSAFGGIGGSLLGTKTGDFLTWVTISLVAVWLLLSVVAARFFRPQSSEYLQSGAPAPAQTSAPASQLPPQTDEGTAAQMPVSDQTQQSQPPADEVPAAESNSNTTTK